MCMHITLFVCTLFVCVFQEGSFEGFGPIFQNFPLLSPQPLSLTPIGPRPDPRASDEGSPKRPPKTPLKRTPTGPPADLPTDTPKRKAVAAKTQASGKLVYALTAYISLVIC